MNSEYTRKWLNDTYGGSRVSGICPIKEKNMIFLFYNENENTFWDNEGKFRYLGEGLKGDMEFTRGNKAIRNHEMNGDHIYLFKKSAYNSNKYTFTGEVVYLNHEFISTSDIRGKQRLSIIFIFANVEKTFNTIIDNKSDKFSSTSVSKKRASTILKVMLRADGKCEYCGKNVGKEKGNLGKNLFTYYLDKHLDGYVSSERTIALCKGCFDNVEKSENRERLIEEFDEILWKMSTSYNKENSLLLKSVRLKNFRGFSEFSLEFDGRITVIAGENATGKSSILEGLTIGLASIVKKYNTKSEWNIKSSDSHISKKEASNIPKNYPIEIECIANFGSEEIIWKRTKESVRGKNTSRHTKQLDRRIDNSSKSNKYFGEELVMPIFTFHSAGRMWMQKRKRWRDPFSMKEVSRFIAYHSCFDEGSDLKSITNWIRSVIKQIDTAGVLDIDATDEALNLPSRFLAVIHSINKFMSYLNNNENVKILYSIENDELLVNEKNSVIQLNKMSSGYRSLIGLVADISYRMAVLNPHLGGSVVKRTHGIVLIDEIDVHLHPRWQKNVLSALKNVFPEVQFIVSTHAPLIISECENNELIYLKDLNQAKSNEQNYKGWTVQEILKDIMGIKNEYSDEFIMLVDKFDNALNEFDHQEGEKILSEIERIIHPSNKVLYYLGVQLKGLKGAIDDFS